MANAAEIADLLTRGLAGPQGPEDIALHTGIVKSWDRQTGINVITINGVDIPNVKALQAGIPNWFVAGDTVLVVRKQTQYFIQGRVAAPGGSAGSGVQFQTQSWQDNFDTGGAWISNPVVGRLTPSVTAYIGASRCALVMWQCDIISSSGDPAVGGFTYNAEVYGEVSFAVTGASNVSPGSFTGMSSKQSTQFGNPQPNQWVQTLTTQAGNYVVSAGIGINPGSNVFTLKFKTHAGVSATFGGPGITVIPF